MMTKKVIYQYDYLRDTCGVEEEIVQNSIFLQTVRGDIDIFFRGGPSAEGLIW